MGHNSGVPCEGEDCIICRMNTDFSHYQDNLMGRLLTLCDAAIVNERQNKAFKDSVREAIHSILWDAREAMTVIVAKRLDLISK